MLLSELVQTSSELAATRSRKQKIERLTALLRRMAGDEIEIGVHFLSGTLRCGRIGLGPAVLRAVAGHAAAAQPTLSLGETDRAFERIAAITGAGSQAARRAELERLFALATAPEQDFLARLILGDLRQGAQQGILLEAIARAAGIDAAALRRAVMLAGEAAPVARDALRDGAAALGRYRLQLFQPVQPMLAQTADDPAELLESGPMAFEYKLDGARIQLHKRDDDVRIYTRRLNEVTAATPELVELGRALPVREAILDGEAIVLRADGRPEAFQTTMRRFGRKRPPGGLQAELPLTGAFFDVLHLDGEDLLDRPLAERLEAIDAALPEELTIPRLVTATPAEAEAFLARALAAGHEGVMAKSLSALYEAGQRGAGWRKLKPAHTLDLVVLAVEWGSGRRRGWLSNLHLGARDPAGGFVMLGKTFKGLTDAMLEWQTQRLSELEIGRDDWVVHVRPELVVEIAFDGVQASPQYPAGLALRFARVKRYRSDKRAAEADTIETVRAIYEQSRR